MDMPFPSLVELDLSSNEIGDYGSLMPLLGTFSALKTLILTDNPMSRSGNGKKKLPPTLSPSGPASQVRVYANEAKPWYLKNNGCFQGRSKKKMQIEAAEARAIGAPNPQHPPNSGGAVAGAERALSRQDADLAEGGQRRRRRPFRAVDSGPPPRARTATYGKLARFDELGQTLEIDLYQEDMQRRLGGGGGGAMINYGQQPFEGQSPFEVMQMIAAGDPAAQQQAQNQQGAGEGDLFFQTEVDVTGGPGGAPPGARSWGRAGGGGAPGPASLLDDDLTEEQLDEIFKERRNYIERMVERVGRGPEDGSDVKTFLRPIPFPMSTEAAEKVLGINRDPAKDGAGVASITGRPSKEGAGGPGGAEGGDAEASVAAGGLLRSPRGTSGEDKDFVYSTSRSATGEHSKGTASAYSRGAGAEEDGHAASPRGEGLEEADQVDADDLLSAAARRDEKQPTHPYKSNDEAGVKDAMKALRAAMPGP